MIKRLFGLCSTVFLVVTLSHPIAKADDATWAAWVYTPTNGELLGFSASASTPEKIRLPVPSGYTEYPANVIINTLGFIGYIVATNDKTSLVVYDGNARKIAFSKPFEQVLTLGGKIFDEAGTSVAVSYSREDQSGAWAIETYNLPDGSAGPVLHSGDPAAVAAQLPAGYQWTPIIRRYSGNQITFSLVSMPSNPAKPVSYVWDTVSNNITPTDAYPTNDVDTLGTGETISAGNGLTVYDPKDGNLFPFYVSADTVVAHPVFIQNGERILFTSWAGKNKYCVLERTGQLVGCLPESVNTEITYIGWQDGFLYLTLPPVESTEHPTLYVVNTRAGQINAGTAIWTDDQPNDYPALIGSSGNMNAKGPVVPWQHLTSAAATEAATP